MADLERFRALTRLASDWFWESQPNHKFTIVCDRLSALFGLSPEEFMQTYDLETLLLGVRPNLRQTLKTVRNGKFLCGAVLHLTDTTGAPRSYELCAKPILGRGGQFCGYRGIAREVTGKTAAEAALGESEERYRTLVNLAPDAMLIWNDQEVLFANPAAATLFGVASPSEFVGQPPFTAVHADDGVALAVSIRRTLTQGITTASGEYRVVRHDGATRDVEGLSAPLQWRGQPAVLSLLHDITERKRAERSVREKQEYYRDLLSTSSDWLWECDPAGTITFVSESFGHRDEFESDAVIGLTVIQLIHPDFRHDETVAVHLHTLDERLPFRDFVFKASLGGTRERWFRISGRPVFGDAGKFLGYRGIGADITVEMLARQEADRKTALLQNIVENIPEGVALFDKNLRLSAHNRRLIEVFSLNPGGVSDRMSVDEMIQMLLARHIVSPALADQLANQCGEAKDIRLAEEIVLESGVTLMVRGSPLADSGVLFTFEDVTATKHAELALRRSEERFRDFAESSSHWLWEMGADLRFTYLSDGVTNILGGKATGLVGQSYRSLMDDKPAAGGAPSPGDEVFANKQAFIELVISPPVAAKSAPIHLSLSGKPVWSETGEFKGYRGVARDITEQLEAVRELEKTRTRLQDAIENINEGFSLYDKDLNLVLCNSKFREMYAPIADIIKPGASLETLMKVGVERGMYAEKIDDIDAWVADQRHQQQTRRVYERQMSDGRWLRISEVRTSEGGLVGVRADMTALRKAEEKLRVFEKLSALGQLAGGVAHDFNNILMVTAGYAKRAFENSSDSAKVRSSLSEVLAATDKGKALTNQLLVFARRQRIEKRTINPADLIREMDGLLRQALGETVECIMSIAVDDAYVETDPDQLTQALLNLAINARDAMPLGGKFIVRLTVDDGVAGASGSDSGDAGQAVRIDVGDTGIGMDATTVSHIFEPFFTTKEQGKGTGLGLAMVYGFVQQSGGSIDVASKVGGGTTFTVRLPRVEARMESKMAAPQAGKVRGHGETILLAEDDAALRRLIQETLESLNYKVLSAEGGLEALEAEKKYGLPIDLLLSDVVMPGMGGFELCKILREGNPDIRVLLISGYPARGIGPSIDFDESIPLLRKPIDLADLARQVRKALDSDVSRLGATMEGMNYARSEGEVLQ